MNEDAQHQHAYEHRHDRSEHHPQAANASPAAAGRLKENWRSSAAHLTVDKFVLTPFL
jgi:hypothetical protein